MRGEREPWSFAADELSSSHFSAWSYRTCSSVVVVVVNTTSLWKIYM
jgi:hypothetical protein